MGNNYLRKKIIAVKRNFYTIPLVLNFIALVIFTCSTYVHSQVSSRITYPESNTFIQQLNYLNAFFLFAITLSAILSVVSYLKYMGRVKNYVMLGLYYLLCAVQIVLEVFFLIGVQNQLKYEKTLESTEVIKKFIRLETNSIQLIVLHFVLLGIAIVVSSFAPLIQSKLKNIKFKRMGENSYENIEALDLSSVDEDE